MMSHQQKILKKRHKLFLKNPIGILEMKNGITQIKNLLVRLKSRFVLAAETISAFQDALTEITYMRNSKKK